VSTVATHSQNRSSGRSRRYYSSRQKSSKKLTNKIVLGFLGFLLLTLLVSLIVIAVKTTMAGEGDIKHSAALWPVTTLGRRLG
jgi:hypothetical protein